MLRCSMKQKTLAKMKEKEINKFVVKYLPNELGFYHAHKDLMYCLTEEFFLKAYYFESGGNGEHDLRVECFIQPLFVKHDSIILTYSEILYRKHKAGFFKRTKYQHSWDARKEHWDISFQSIFQVIVNQGERYLRSFKTAKDFVRIFKSDMKDNIRIREAVTYTNILIFSRSRQNRMLKRLIKHSLTRSHRDTDWVDRIREDATLLLNAQTQEQRMDILRNWADETKGHLKLPGLI